MEEQTSANPRADRGFRRVLAGHPLAIARGYLLVSLVFLMLGGLLALYIRWQLAFPGKEIPVWLAGPLAGDNLAPDGVIGPDGYLVIMTMHATYMIYFAILPLVVGFFANLLVPLQIGARSHAFPRLATLSLVLTVIAGLVMVGTFFVEGGGASTGWTAYPPLSAVPSYTSPGSAQDIWCIAILIDGMGLILGSVNILGTIITRRASGMTLLRMPLTVWSQMVTSILILLSIPVLAVAIGMLLMDRNAGTSFFLPSGLSLSGTPIEGLKGGGAPLLWQHLFWFFGHPIVYVMILPAMGIVSEILSVFSRKPVFGYRGMVISMSSIAFLGFLVWGHHMFQSGMNPMLGATFMFSTMVIAVPSGLKLFNWIGTLWGGRIHFELPMLHALAFIALFAIGGMSGIYMASTPVDSFIHDTYFIVGHIHYVLFGGSLFAAFAGISYWFPLLTGRHLDKTLGRVHFWISFVAFNCTFFPMHVLGAGGMMRRIYDFRGYAHLQHFDGLNVFMTISAIVLGGAQLLLLANMVRSRTWGEVAGSNPWRANTLEWSDRTGDLVVYRGPHEYSRPDTELDYLPQHVEPIGTLGSATGGRG